MKSYDWTEKVQIIHNISIDHKEVESRFIKINREYNSDIDYLDIISKDCDRSILYKMSLDNVDILVSEIKEYTQHFIKRYRMWYYQGFNDLIIYFYLLYKDDEHIVKNIIDFHFYPYLTDRIKFEDLLNVLTDVLECLDSTISNTLLQITYTQPYYALSWIITWFSHNNTDIKHQYKIIQYLLFSQPVTIFYFTAVVTIINLDYN
jgi:hypothetical protein